MLGPTLFLCYINDIVDLEFDSGVGLCADDTVLYVSGQLISDLEVRMNRNWAIENRPTINEKKKKFMVFPTTRLRHTTAIDLGLNNIPLSTTESYDYQGINLDCRLSFESHISRLLASCNQRLATLSMIRRYIDERTNCYKNL